MLKPKTRINSLIHSCQVKGPVYRISLAARMSIIYYPTVRFCWILYSKNMHRDTIQIAMVLALQNLTVG